MFFHDTAQGEGEVTSGRAWEGTFDAHHETIDLKAFVVVVPKEG